MILGKQLNISMLLAWRAVLLRIILTELNREITELGWSVNAETDGFQSSRWPQSAYLIWCRRPPQSRYEGFSHIPCRGTLGAIIAAPTALPGSFENPRNLHPIPRFAASGRVALVVQFVGNGLK